MKNKYVIVLGIAFLVSAITGYLFQQKKYFILDYDYDKKVEISQKYYVSQDPIPAEFVVEKRVDLSLMLLSFLTVIGSGLVITSISFNRKGVSLNTLKGNNIY